MERMIYIQIMAISLGCLTDISEMNEVSTAFVGNGKVEILSETEICGRLIFATISLRISQWINTSLMRSMLILTNIFWYLWNLLTFGKSG